MVQLLQSRPRFAWPPEIRTSDTPRTALLMLDTGLDPLGRALVERGIKVFRTEQSEMAQDLVRWQPLLLMAIIRMSEPSLGPLRLIADLRAVRPDLWIGMLAEGAPKELLAAGYAAGATDILQFGRTPEESADRVIRSLPSPARVLELRHRRNLQKTRERKEAPISVGSLIQKARRRVWLLAGAATVGVVLAIFLRTVLGTLEQADARVERLMAAIEGAREVPDRVGRQIDRYYRDEDLKLRRGSLDSQRRFYDQQIEETRLRDLFRKSAPIDGASGVPDRIGRQLDRLFRDEDLKPGPESLGSRKRADAPDFEDTKMRELFRRFFTPRYSGAPAP